jgi:hypothetical protein
MDTIKPRYVSLWSSLLIKLNKHKTPALPIPLYQRLKNHKKQLLKLKSFCNNKHS